MKRIIFLCLLFFFPALQIRAQRVITLDECYILARENYPLVQQYGLINRLEEYNLSNASKGWLPQLSVNGKATYQSDVTKLPFDQDMLSSIIPGFEIPTVSKDQYQINGEVTQNLWDGGNIRSAREITRAQAMVDREQLDSDLYTLNQRVNQLFFGALLQDELLGQNELLQYELGINLDRIASMIENGVANNSDMESMEVELLNARQQAIDLKASRTAYRSMLGMLTGLVIHEDDRLETPNIYHNYLPLDIHRPELKLFEAQSRLIETQNKQITAGLMPKFGLFFQGGYGRPGLNMLEDSFEPFYITGLRMSWNIGNFYTAKNDRKKLNTNRQSVDIQRDVFLFNTKLDMLQQDNEVNKMGELIETDTEIIRLRSSIKKAAEVKLENGIISVTDLIREINAEDQAKQQAAIHRIQHLMAVYNYLYTTNN